jgi:hypothetical protein
VSVTLDDVMVESLRLQIIQTLGNRSKFGAKESFMTVMIEHLESLECSARLDTFLSNILTLSLDSDFREDVPPPRP